MFLTPYIYHMNKYTLGLLVSIGLVIISTLSAYSASDPNLVIGSSIGIIIFWLTSLIFVFLRGLSWYKSDLAERTAKELERQDQEGITNEDIEDGLTFDFAEKEE